MKSVVLCKNIRRVMWKTVDILDRISNYFRQLENSELPQWFRMKAKGITFNDPNINPVFPIKLRLSLYFIHIREELKSVFIVMYR